MAKKHREQSAGNAGKKKSKKKLLLPFGAVILAVGYTVWALTQPLLSIAGQVSYTVPSKPASAAALDWPSYGEAAVGVAGYGVLDSHGPQKALPTASIAKVLTALAVLRQRPLQIGASGPDIVITQADVDSYNHFVANDGSVVGVSLGEHISEYQALQALLLPSANNMAWTLARWAFGSVTAYNAYANAYASQLGLSSLHITDPSGYDPATIGSARDLTALGTLAMLNPVFADIVGQPSARIPVQGTIYNYNFRLGKNGNIGIKTGNNDADKGAFLFASKQMVAGQTITIVGAIMGGNDLATVLGDSDPLITSTVQGFSSSTFVRAGQSIGSYQVAGRGPVNAIASNDLSLLTWHNITYQGSASLQPITGAFSAGTSVGTVRVTNTTSHVSSQVAVKLQSATQQPSLRWRLLHPLGK